MMIALATGATELERYLNEHFGDILQRKVGAILKGKDAVLGPLFTCFGSFLLLKAPEPPQDACASSNTFRTHVFCKVRIYNKPSH